MSDFSALNIIPDAFIVLDRNHRIVFRNRAAASLIRTDAFLEMCLQVDGARSYLERAMASTTMIPGTLAITESETPWVCLAGRIDAPDPQLLLKISPHGISSPFMALNTQLAELQRENHARRTAERTLQTRIDGLPFALKLKRDGVIILTNQAYQAWFGSQPPDTTAVVFTIEADGQTHHYTSAKFGLTISDDDPVECVVFSDVTLLKEAEEAREKMHANILHAQKLESLGVLAGGIAHDFNNLLVGILGNAELALSDIPADSRTRMYIKDVILSSQRAAELCMQMLAYSGKGRFVVRSLDLNEVINEMISLLRVSISKKAVLKTRLTSTPPIVEADVTQLRQVLMNLITNASDALDDEPGVITITTGHTVLSPENDPYNAMREISAGPYVWFEVNDTGSGMSSETIERMFDPFFTTKPSGRGLGLAAVSGIIRGHGGTFRVYSEPNSGTTFKVFLPSRIGDPFQEPQRPTVQVAKPGGLVLIVDDEPGVRRVARRVAERAGFEVIEAADGQAAVEIFKEHHHEIAVVLLDMSMPAMSGEETFRAMREITPDVRVILSSGYNEQDATSYFVGRGLAGFLQKPYRPSDLFALLQAAVE